MNKEIEYIKNRAQGIARYSDKLREEMEKIDAPYREAFKNAGIKYTGKVFYTDNSDSMGMEKYYSMKVTRIDDVWKIWIKVSNNLVPEDIDWEDFSSIPRDVLKAAAKVVLPFLTEYSKILAEKLNEYHDLAQKTQKMASAIL